MAIFYPAWSPCTECHCPNHHVPSHSFPPERHALENSNLAPLTRSNDPPLPAEADTLNAMISSYQAEIKDIDSEESNITRLSAEMRENIVHLDQKVELLRGERIRISQAISERKRLLSPIRQLPAEILSHIFLQTIEFPIEATQTDAEDMWWKFRCARSAPWSIALVSRRWRQVALDFPQLWSYRIGEHMLHSEKHKLSICIANDPDSSTFEELPLPLATIVCSIANRIRDLHLFLPSSIFANLPSLHLFLPQLERLSLLCTDGEAIFTYTGLKIFDFSPKLHSMQVMDIGSVSPLFVLPWPQITQFKSEHTHLKYSQPGSMFNEVLDFISVAVNLEECFVECDNRGDTLTRDPVACPKLHTLTVLGIYNDEHYDPVFPLLERLTLPSLTTLVIGKVGHKDREPPMTFTAIWDMIARSKCNLRVLHYDHGGVLAEDFIGLLRGTPTLEDLRLTGGALGPDTVTEQTLTELTVKLDGTRPFVPNLHTLFLDGTIVFPMKVFAEMVESRWTLADVVSPPVRQLRNISICTSVRADEREEENEKTLADVTALSVLDAYKAQGLVVTMNSRQI
ncbi:hypothetical protein EV421DRAFT_766326 [Armillaria borealis]|uniref:F-box domain-containing protein n=1 Tax=Armillaria borealis TaxID=47425 RepID=A0AA39JDV9_9AGAR|nr:hypothetical protein EV421DRAFT_766326 [Armillaria borealis]